MATLLLTAAGTALGGPIGGAIGSLVGSAVDRTLFTAPERQGPRLEELAVTTSSYGQPIARHYGRMRVAGTIVWATDLTERSETSGGKGRPRTTTYSYSISFAVMLASHPIDAVGRIWADGNLLRGNAGDLKSGGVLRVHSGHGDQGPDPLLLAALGAQCPAFRGRAYAVFEDLPLEDFGNRIPALTFEVFAGGASGLLAHLVGPVGAEAQEVAELEGIAGYSHRGGSLSDTLAPLAGAVPLLADARGGRVSVGGFTDGTLAPTLGESVVLPGDDAGPATGTLFERRDGQDEAVAGLRYYDRDRDYQPGVQRAPGQAAEAQQALLELPATLSAPDAQLLARRIALRHRETEETQRHRIAELDPAIGPGSLVRLPDASGLWRVMSWEWSDSGIELELSRQLERAQDAASTSAGAIAAPADRVPGGTQLEAFELPWDGLSDLAKGRVFAALGAQGGSWSGAALYAERSGALVPLANSQRRGAVLGSLESALESSPALIFERAARLSLVLDSNEMALESAPLEALAQGRNRILVGEEILQFGDAYETAPGRYTLTGLLRGRGGTEAAALAGHAAGTRAILLDEGLIALDPAGLAPGDRVAAIGAFDAEPQISSIAMEGAALRPLAPVHPRAETLPDGSLRLGWTRRARGSWRWLPYVDAPLVEESEAYEVGCGKIDAPLARWSASSPTVQLSAGDLTALGAQAPGAALWVRQIGSFARSPAVLLTHLPPTS